MMHTILYALRMCAAITLVVSCLSCGSSDSTGGGGGGDTPGVGDSATLSAADFPAVGVCSTGSTDVTEPLFTGALAGLTQFTFMHLPYSSDADIPFICGREGSWDPENANAFKTVNVIDATTPMSQVIQGFLGQVLICNTGFNFTDFNQGLHDATTYRAELTWTDGGTTYRARVRFTISGADAGKTLASLGLTSADLKLTDKDGNELTTIGDVLDLFIANAGSVTVNVVSDSTVHITALGRVICWGTE